MRISIHYDPAEHKMTLHLDSTGEGCSLLAMPFDEFVRLVEAMQAAVAQARVRGRQN